MGKDSKAKAKPEQQEQQEQAPIAGDKAIPAKNEKGANGASDKAKAKPKPEQQEQEEAPSAAFFTIFALGVLAASRAAAAAVGVIGDCDETFNYYEPAHWLLYGTGMQTWEYSPVYALRSYLFLLPYVGIARITALFGAHKIAVFFAIRGAIGTFSAGCATYLCRQVRKTYGLSSGLVCLVFLALAPGLAASSASFLPSSFAAEMLSLAYASWLARRDSFVPIMCVAFASLLAWPFSALAAVPLALALLCQNRLLALVWRGLVALALVVCPLVAVDSWFYGRLVLAPFNIVQYNVIKAPEGGSTLYGVEPWHFYLANGALNLSVVLPLAFVALLISVVSLPFSRPATAQRSRRVGMFVLSSAVALWLGFMSLQAHKEERFGFVVYPLACAAAAAACRPLSRIRVGRLPVGSPAVFVAVVVFSLLSVSRIAAIHQSYSAPMEAWAHVSSLVEMAPKKQKITVCVAKEWYRFPSSFFLPRNAKLRYVESGFSGLLPRPWTTSSRAIPPYMNDRNKAERADKRRYVENAAGECHLLVDREFAGQTEPKYARLRPWTVDWASKFLDTEASPKFWRAFVIPESISKALFGRAPPSNVWSTYYVLTNFNLPIGPKKKT